MATDPSLASLQDDTEAPSALETKLQELIVQDALAMPADIEEFLSSIDPLDSVELLLASADRDETPTIAAQRSTISTDSSSDNESSMSESSNQPNSLINQDRRRCGHRPGAMRNPSRERMQSEIAQLRKQVLDLEIQLQSEHEKKLSSSIWERIAKRQLAACERAEKENKRFKSMVELQKELIVGMEDLLYNWQQVASPQPQEPTSTLVPRKNVHLEPGDILLFEMLVSELDATYLKIDEAFQDAGIDQAGSSESFIRVTPKTTTAASAGTVQSYLELVKVKVSPFAFDQMHPAVKVCGEKQRQSPDCVVYHGDWGFEDITTQKHRVKRVCDGGGEIYLHMLMALKMYTFEDEIVCIWQSIFKGGEQFPDAYVQEVGWLTSENLVSQRVSGTSSKTGSRTRLCVHLEPKSFAKPTSVIKTEADDIANHVVSCYCDVLDETNAMIENLLIQELEENRELF